ncbi:Sensor protein gacS [Mycena venus]|uniref:Sensor protein gacS n=1 Tax=Mycena venus TaxID=2733690 RepID=A0A8H6YHG5_9AGAR|nr:Sensor protein gacS [Mycena venus]
MSTASSDSEDKSMSTTSSDSEDNKIKTSSAKISISGGRGGRGGASHGNDGIGGKGGKGEGPKVKIVNQGQGLEEVLHKWLCIPSDLTDRHHELQSLRHKDTGSWLLHDDQFIRWKATPGSLWIQGISGTGKSVLRLFVLLICT